MNILADENVSGEIVRSLRAVGYKVEWIAETSAGISDNEVLHIAKQKGCFLLTSDKAFASIAARDRSQKLHGVLFLRLEGMSVSQTAHRVLKIVQSRDDWDGIFGILGVDGIRIRNLPI
jgi:predicted nuclease of predicted toxin-antitoxin system